MSYNKRIVLDFDDTLSFTTNRDWENATPNFELISRINRLFDEGWDIDIYTSRGSLSCANREEASKKYRNQIERWLNKHGVNYHNLSFEKPLAAYYVDDKAYKPEDFLKVDIRQLEGGLSGREIFTDGRFVYKIDPNCHKVADWYSNVNGILNVPEIESVVGENLKMEYISHDKDFFLKNKYIAIGLILDSLDKMRSLIVPQNNFVWKDYVNRIAQHAKNAGNPKQFELTIDMLQHLYIDKTFSHGDFGITNMLFDEKSRKLYLIDPIPDVFGSTALDAAKFIASLMINHYSDDYINFAITIIKGYLYENKIHPSPLIDNLNFMIAGEIIRVFKYHPNKEFIFSLLEKKNVF